MNMRTWVNFETLIYSAYYAPRGRQRLYRVAAQLSQRYLSPNDLLIGVIGAEGAGKSTLIRGLFPGLELTNDDDGINMQSAALHTFAPDDPLSGHTFHLDIRHELAFRQKAELVEAIKLAISHGRRVVVEHFDLVHEALGYNAQVLFGIGEEILVARPSIFGPFPRNIKAVVDRSIKFRLMAHSAEDLTSMILARDYGYRPAAIHSDVKHGFVIRFPEPPAIDLNELEAKVQAFIARNLPITVSRTDHIRVEDMEIYCTGTRTHVPTTGKIENFRLLKEYRHCLVTDEFMLVGRVGGKEVVGIEDINDDLDPLPVPGMG